MKNWKLSLLMVAAALALQACDVEVHDAPKQAAATSEPAPAPATETAPSIASSVPQEPVGAEPAAEAPAAAASAAPETMAAASQPEQTNAMGAPAAPTTSDASAMPADNTPAGVAAPSELARFLQDNPIRAASTDASAKPDAAQAGGKSGGTKS